MVGPILFLGYKEQESNLILPEHDDDEISLWKRCIVCIAVCKGKKGQSVWYSVLSY